MAERPVVVVGGGPSGLAAAWSMRQLGIGAVIVLERESDAGGIPRHSDHIGYGIKDLRRVLSGPRYAAVWRERAVASGVDVRTASTVTGWTDDLVVDVTSRAGRYTLDAAALVLATGCRERPRSARLVPGDRPAGILTTGQLQQLVNLNHVTPGTSAVIVGAEHVSYSAAVTLAEARCRTVAMVTDQPRHTSFHAFDRPARLRYRFPLLTESFVSDIRGSGRVTHVDVTHRPSGEVRTIECDTVVFTGDWIADHELAARHDVGIDPHSTGVRVDASLRSGVPGVFAIGNVVHPAETADVCTADGSHVAASVAHWLGTRSWPTQHVALEAAAPLLWVAPHLLSDLQRPARNRLVLRASTFRRAPRLVVSQGGTTLWRGRVPWLVPTRPVYVRADWLEQVSLDAGAPPVVIGVDE